MHCLVSLGGGAVLSEGQRVAEQCWGVGAEGKVWEGAAGSLG